MSPKTYTCPSCGTIVQEPAECVLKTHPEWNSCCCVCRNLIIDGSHPDTDGGHIMQQRGWICIGFAYQEAEALGFSGWTAHGMCELFDRRPEHPEPVVIELRDPNVPIPERTLEEIEDDLYGPQLRVSKLIDTPESYDVEAS